MKFIARVAIFDLTNAYNINSTYHYETNLEFPRDFGPILIRTRNGPQGPLFYAYMLGPKAQTSSQTDWAHSPQVLLLRFWENLHHTEWVEKPIINRSTNWVQMPKPLSVHGSRFEIS